MSALASFPGLKGARGGAFYLHGDDEFRKEEAVRALIEAHLDPSTADFNLDPLRGSEVSPETLASVLATPPMMAEWRVVVLREVEGLASSKHARETLLAVAGDPPPGLCLIMSCTVPNGSTAKFYRELARAARAVGFRALSEADVPGWIIARAREVNGVEVDVEAAQGLGAAIGSYLGVLAMELDKLAAFVGERARITLEDVEAAGTSLPEQNRWTWLDLVAERRFEQARLALPVLFGQGESGVGLVIALTSHMLMLGVGVERRGTALAESLPPRQRWLAKKIGQQARRWTAAEVDRALAGLLDVDRLLKASSHSAEHFLEVWLLGLTAFSEAAA